MGRVGDDIETAVAVNIGGLGLVEVETFDHHVPGEVSFAVSEKDVGLGLRVRAVQALLGAEDINTAKMGLFIMR
jgi:hypothetical protein